MSQIDLRSLRETPASAGKSSAPKKSSGLSELLNRDISFSRGGLSLRKRERLYHELSILLEAGLDLKAALELVEQEQAKEKERKLIGGLKDGLIAGATLSGAMSKAKVFSAYEVFSVQIGEETGRLASVLSQLASFYQRRAKQRAQLIGSLTYPALVVAFAFGAIAFMLRFIVPMFEEVFQRFGGELPTLTQYVIDASEGLGRNAKWIGLFSLGAIVTLYLTRKAIWMRRFSSAVLLRIPIIGSISRKSYQARFAQSMALLCGAQVPILRSLGLVRQMIPFYPLSTALADVEQKVMHGARLHESLREHKFFSSRLVSMIRVGEEVNRLDDFFQKVSDQLGDEVERQAGNLGSLLEPLLIIFLGVFVSIILVAMYLPLFSMSTGMVE